MPPLLFYFPFCVYRSFSQWPSLFSTFLPPFWPFWPNFLPISSVWSFSRHPQIFSKNVASKNFFLFAFSLSRFCVLSVFVSGLSRRRFTYDFIYQALFGPLKKSISSAPPRPLSPRRLRPPSLHFGFVLMCFLLIFLCPLIFPLPSLARLSVGLMFAEFTFNGASGLLTSIFPSFPM